MEIEIDKIRDLFTDKTGRDLITCMLLIQPVTKKELRYFLDTLFRLYVFNVSKNSDFRRDNPHVSQKISVFSKSTLDQKDRAFHKALEAGLIIEIQENNKIRNNFYMINSNLRFQINSVHKSDNPLKIDVFKNSKSYSITHEINVDKDNYIDPLKKIKEQHNQNCSEQLNEKISLPNEGIPGGHIRNSVPYFKSINQIMTLLHWLCCPKHRCFIIDYIENADGLGNVDKKKLSKDVRKNEYFRKEAIENEILYLIPNKPHVYQLSEFLMPFIKDDQSIEFFFARSYNPLFCFSNYLEHSDEIEKGISPVDLLNILTEEKKCKIIPEKRNKRVFSSLLYKPSYFKIKKSMSLQDWQKNKNVFIPLRNTACIRRDVFDISENYSILSSRKNIDLKTKLSMSNYSHHGGFLFSVDRV